MTLVRNGNDVTHWSYEERVPTEVERLFKQIDRKTISRMSENILNGIKWNEDGWWLVIRDALPSPLREFIERQRILG